MTIDSEIQRIHTNIANAYDALEAKGATMPLTEDSNNLASTVATISTGGGGDEIMAINNTGVTVLSDNKVWINTKGIDLTNIGNVTISNDFIASGFENGKYLVAPSSICEIGNTFYYHFRTGNAPSNTIRLYTLEAFDALLETSARGLLVYSWSARQFTTLMTVSNNTEYWLRVNTSTGKRSYAISTDGIIYGTETVIVDTTYGPQPSGTFYWGCYTNSEFWNGSIYLNDCYVKNSSNFEIWRGVKNLDTMEINSFSNANKYSLTGIAKENIASGSTGQVETVLPE